MLFPHSYCCFLLFHPGVLHISAWFCWHVCSLAVECAVCASQAFQSKLKGVEIWGNGLVRFIAENAREDRRRSHACVVNVKLQQEDR